jgi:hypothetical protein
MSDINTSKLVVILDSIGRTVLGEQASKDAEVVKLKNPVILHIVPADNQGKMSVQLLPVFFREFLADKTGDAVFNYRVDNIVTTDIDAIDFRLQAQYKQMFNPENGFVNTNNMPPNQPSGLPPKVVDLFDENK